MTEEEYISLLRDNWPDSGEASEQAIRLASDAVDAYPESAILWRMFGNILELAPDTLAMPDVRSIDCYRRAIDINPSDANAWKELAFYLDVFDNKYKEAEEAFRAAVSLCADPASYWGLARVLAEQGRDDEAIRILDACPFSRNPDVQRTRREIVDGIWHDRER